MKIGFYCESPVDSACLAVFVEAILGAPPEPISKDLDGHSVPAFFNVLDGIIRGVHYNSDAEGLVLVVDSDDSPIHIEAHDSPGSEDDECRFCRTRKIVANARKRLKSIPGRSPVKVAIGLAVPALEGWLMVGKNHQVKESAWVANSSGGRGPFTRQQLKEMVYKANQNSWEDITKRAVEEATRFSADIQALVRAFPMGFGLMEREIRSWKT